MNVKSPINLLYFLIEANKNRIEGYDRLIKKTKDNDLKSLFRSFSNTSKKNNNELLVEIIELKVLENRELSLTDRIKLFLKKHFDKNISKNRKDILKGCILINQRSINKYKKILNEEFKVLNIFQQALIKNQLNLIHNDSNIIKNMFFKLK